MFSIDLSPFTFSCTDPNISSFNDLLGQRMVIYFYPKDNTPGCTLESKDFSALLADFKKENTLILGVSRDSCASHAKFQQKQGLSVILISDPDDVLGNAFQVIKQKSLFANTFLGVERSTFLFDEKGHCRHVWRKVKVTGHAAAVLETVRTL